MIETTQIEKKGKVRENYSHKKADTHKAKRREEAEIRQEKYDALTVSEKVELALKRGGSKKELARLKTPKKSSLPHITVDVPSTPVVETQPVKKYKKGKKVKN